MTLRSTRRKLSLRIESLERRRVLSADALSYDDGPGDVRHEMECEVELHGGLDDDSPDDTFDDHGTDNGGAPDSSQASTELEARLTGDSLARGQAKFEIELEHGAEKRELVVDVRGAEPASLLAVVIDGTPVGQVQVDAKGEGRLELSSHPGDDELPLPDNFPAVHAGSTVTVGDHLSGTFLSESTTASDDSADDDSLDDHSSDDVSDDVSDDSSDDSSNDSTDDVSDDSSDDSSNDSTNDVSDDSTDDSSNDSTDDVSDDSSDDSSNDSTDDVSDDSSMDLTGDDRLDAADIDHIFAAVRAGSQEDRLDLNKDQQVDDHDGRFLVEAVFGSNSGDANLDGVFDSDDLILVFQQGQYEDGVSGNSGWGSGDWNGDGEFDSADLVAAFQTGRYR